MSVVFYIFLFLFLFLCVLLSFVILIQESKSMGLGASFGGDAGDSLFGTSTAEVLKKFTSYLIVIFLASCVIISLWTSRLSQSRSASPLPPVEEIENE